MLSTQYHIRSNNSKFIPDLSGVSCRRGKYGGGGKKQTKLLKVPKTLQKPILCLSALTQWLSNLVCRHFKRARDHLDSAWFSNERLTDVWNKALIRVANSSTDMSFYRHEWENNTHLKHPAGPLETIPRPLVSRHSSTMPDRGSGAEWEAEAQGA